MRVIVLTTGLIPGKSAGDDVDPQDAAVAWCMERYPQEFETQDDGRVRLVDEEG